MASGVSGLGNLLEVQVLLEVGVGQGIAGFFVSNVEKTQ